MPMLAGSAAARLTQQILSRLSSPHAMHTTSPVRPGALWRQVGRRLGILPQERSRPGPGRPMLTATQARIQEQARPSQDPFAPPPTQLVWRAAPSNKQAQEEEVPVEARLAAAMRPSRPPASPQTPQALPQPATPPAAPAFVTGTPSVTGVPEQTFVQPTLAEATSAAQAPAPVPQVADGATAGLPPTQPAAPATTVVVQYLPGPAALPVQPLVSHAPLIETSSYTPRNIAESLNRDLVPTTDMISRMVRPSWEDLPLPAPASQAPVTTPAGQQPAQLAAQPQQVAPSVVQAPSLPVEDAPRLEMPLAATTVSSSAAQRAPSRTPEETLERAERGPVRQVIERVASALPLPEAVRRFITGEPAPVEKQVANLPIETTPPVAGQQAGSAPAPAQREVAPVSFEPQTRQPVPSAVAETQPPAQTATPAVATPVVTNNQPVSAPAEAMRSERGGNEVVSAPSPASAPSAIEMPMRSPAQVVSRGGQQASQQAGQTGSAALGPFQPFETYETAEPARQDGPAQRTMQPTQPAARQAHVAPDPESAARFERPVQLQPAEAPVAASAAPVSVSRPLGPFEPFVPAQPIVVEETRSATQDMPPGRQPAVSAGPPGVSVAAESPSGASTVSATLPSAQAPAAESSEGTAQASSAQDAARETMASREVEQRGFLGSLFNRFFGRAESVEEEQPQPRTTSVEMPWVRAGRSARSQTDDVRQAAPTLSSTPFVTSMTPSVPADAQSTQVQQPQSEPGQTPEFSQPPQPATTQAPVPVQQQEAVAESVNLPPGAVGQAASAADREIFTAPQIGQVPVEIDVESVPGLSRVVEMGPPASQPTPLDMPHAAASVQPDREVPSPGAADLLQMATLPSQAVSLPPVELPVEVPTSYVAPDAVLATAALEVEQARQAEPEAPPQAWTLMPDVADALVRSHAPLSAVEPMETAVQGELLARITGGLGQEIVATSVGDSTPRSVPAPTTGVGTELPVARSSAGPSQAASNIAESAFTTGPVVSPSPASVSVPAQAAMPIGAQAAAPIVSRPQLMPDSLRDIRTASNQPTASEGFGRAVAADVPVAPSAAATPEAVAMPPRYITNVTPASYVAETAFANMQGGDGGQSGVPDLGTIMRPASHMSPSMGDYGWPGADGQVSGPSLMLPLSAMSPMADSYVQSDGGQGEQPQLQQQGQQNEQAPWMSALQALYGQPQSNSEMPLAIPYGAFALPTESAGSTASWQGPSFAQQAGAASQMRPTSDGFSSLPMPTPSTPYFGSNGAGQSFTQSSSFVTSAAPSWSADSGGSSGFSSWSTDGYSDGDSEAGAWADVVASAVSGASEGSPALSLAGEERGSSSSSSSSSQEPTNTQDGAGKSAGPELEELAESVLDIIRHRLLIERERNFG